MFWIFVTMSYLIVFDSQINATIEDEDSISAEVILTNGGHYYLNLTWDKLIERSAVSIKSLNETCKISCFRIINDSTTSFLIPPYTHTNEGATSIIENHDCKFTKRCWYNVTLERAGNPYWNKAIYFPECVNGVCMCENHSEFPKFKVWAKVLSIDNIVIKWSANISETTTNSSFQKTENNKIEIRVYKLLVPELDWGGESLLIQDYILPLKINSSSNVVQEWKLNSQSTFLPKMVFIIWAQIIDSKGCRSAEEEHFKLIVPELTKGEENKYVISYKTVPILITIIFFGIIIVLFVVYKILQNSKLTYWKNTYQTIDQPRPIVHIPMESNILYIDKDNILNDNDDYFEICPSRITLSYEIDAGAFGKVYKGFLKHRNGSTMIVAIKLLKKKKISDLEEEFLNEIETMKNVGKHEHIVELLGCCTKQEPMKIIMEYVGGGNLLKYLQRIGRNFFVNNRNDDDDSFGYEATQRKYADIMLSGSSISRDSSSYISQPERNFDVLRPSISDTMYTNLSECNDFTLNCDELHNFALQIAKGMHYLEKKGITHRDLAARNILITEKKLLKISDFGLSRNGIYVKKTTGKIPLRWLSIEAIRENSYSSKSDVWAFGIVLWEIGTLGVSPYPGIENGDVLNYLLSGNRLEKPAICSDELYNLMTDCWKENMKERPSFSEILTFLRPESKNIYVQLNSLGSNYVFESLQKKV